MADQGHVQPPQQDEPTVEHCGDRGFLQRREVSLPGLATRYHGLVLVDVTEYIIWTIYHVYHLKRSYIVSTAKHALPQCFYVPDVNASIVPRQFLLQPSGQRWSQTGESVGSSSKE